MRSELRMATLFCRRVLFTGMLGLAAGCLAQGADWSTNIPLLSPRYWHTATLLPSGEVLVAGGYDDSANSLTNAELYDPAAKTWTVTGGMNDPRALFTATLLTNGQVLAAGGMDFNSGTYVGTLASAELFNPATGQWTATDPMASARHGHTATLLPDGEVLVAGGIGDSSSITNCELFDPATGAWSPTGGLNTPRSFHTATLLPNGLVLAAGGDTNNPSTSELYNPATGTWTLTAQPMITNCFLHTAILLPDGQVLVAGGYDAIGETISSAELFDPRTETWTATATPLNAGRAEHCAALLPDGTVLVAGGYGGAAYVGGLSSAEIYNPATGIWTVTNQMNSARGDFTATTLTNGDVLVTGGYSDTSGLLAGTELFGPNSTALTLHGAILQPSGAFQVAFASFPHSSNTVWAATDPALPLSGWSNLGTATEFSPGLFVFIDSDATSYTHRLYRASEP